MSTKPAYIIAHLIWPISTKIELSTYLLTWKMDNLDNKDALETQPNTGSDSWSDLEHFFFKF